MTDTPAWTGVVLAGGRSSRMGRDKAMLPWRGRPLVEYMVELLREAGAGRARVSGHHPALGGVPDSVPDLGPLGGLASVAADEADGMLLVIPVDMPDISAALLARLAQAPACACTCYAGHVLPMRLRWDARSREVLAQLCAGPGAGRSLRALHAALEGGQIELAPGEAGLLRNCNTPEEWRALQP